MKYVVAVNGSRGDVQPAVALGIELAGRGHTVTMLVPPDLTGFAAATGLPTQPYGESTREVLVSELVRDRMQSRNPVVRLRAVTELSIRGGRSMQQHLLEATEDADAIIAGSVGQERAHNVARVRRIPHIPLHLCPLRRNGSTSLLTHFGITAPAPVARESWRAVEWLLWCGGRSAEATLAAELGLTAVRAPFATQIAATGVPEIQAYDPVLFPQLPVEWRARRPLVGFFTLPGAHRAGVGDLSDPDLDDWITNGPEPVYVGFGSMMPTNTEHLADAFRSAAEQMDLRLLVSGGWSGFMSGIDDDRVRVVGHIDHDAVLPRCAAAVHHGGAGSVAAGLRAGIPTVVTWVGADQPIWGDAVARSHVGSSFPMARVDSARLVAALRHALDEKTRRTASDLSARLVDPEHAVAAAATIAEQVTDEWSRQHSV
ncbi:glycosyltransferase [Gordonia sp. CPCC 206044]|uniref:glycosyltransferase n=1 Tax=Gordonia sp. CPCC 206044 TaxID=3140793 RepID=UPI003AF33DEA